MSGEFIYARKYVIFKNEHSNIQGLNPKGHGLLEVRENKGKLSINVERCQSDFYYNVYLVGREGEDIVETFIGKVITDDVGKGTVKLLFNPRNVEGSNNPIENYNSIVLRRGAQILLVGHIKNGSGSFQKYLSKIQVDDYGENIVEENVEIDEIVEDIQVEEETYEDEELEEAYSEVEESTEEEEFESIVEEVVEESFFEEDPIEEILEEESKFVDAENTNFKAQMTNYVLSILRFFPYVKPFNVELSGYDWWKIESDGVNIHRGFLPFYNYLLNMYHA